PARATAGRRPLRRVEGTRLPARQDRQGHPAAGPGSEDLQHPEPDRDARFGGRHRSRALQAGRARRGRAAVAADRPGSRGGKEEGEPSQAMTRKFYIRTFGCQMNEYDSDKLADVLRAAHGMEPAQSPEEA